MHGGGGCVCGGGGIGRCVCVCICMWVPMDKCLLVYKCGVVAVYLFNVSCFQDREFSLE